MDEFDIQEKKEWDSLFVFWQFYYLILAADIAFVFGHFK